MFANPSAAARASADKQGNTGNSAWGRRMRALKAAKHYRINQLLRAPVTCTYCGQVIAGAIPKQQNRIVQQRLAVYEQCKRAAQAE